MITTDRVKRTIIGRVGFGTAGLVLLATLLSACGTEPEPVATPSASPTPTVTAPATGIVAPGEDLVVLPEEQAPSTSSSPTAAAKPTTAAQKKSSENPEVKNTGTTASSKLPEGTVLPDEGQVLKEASRFDGYNSFVAISFKTTWEEAVEELRASMESSGWECYECIPFVAGPNAPKATDNFRYLLNMERDGHKVFTVFAVMKTGEVIASLTFQG